MAKDDEKTTEEAPAKGGKKKLIIIAAIALVALLGGGFAGYKIFSPKKVEAEPAPTPGVVSVLDAITINLADGHYLKLKMTQGAGHRDRAVQQPEPGQAPDRRGPRGREEGARGAGREGVHGGQEERGNGRLLHHVCDSVAGSTATGPGGFRRNLQVRFGRFTSTCSRKGRW
ncbi:hypothetical protein [Dactylosporangium matsuzakiense]|uniref:Uncharacterized protein n=1 Tax=Dactylosporangium matsuzakiense TaxID=53360 RepID=A0A9W6L065_9ACTN|nr:hypothetical protein [Dactylosporangium matsuzakiense]GLL08619.1 hypothetical protein GCM10017581_103860 [Dactylosporangium matsuzakiense]